MKWAAARGALMHAHAKVLSLLYFGDTAPHVRFGLLMPGHVADVLSWNLLPPCAMCSSFP